MIHGTECHSSRNKDHGTSRFIWKFDRKRVFRGYNPFVMYPFMINKFLSQVSDEESHRLLDGKHYLRIQTSDEEDQSSPDFEHSSFVIEVLDIDRCEDEEYKNLLRHGFLPCIPEPMLPFIGFYSFPCEMYIGPFWYLFKINREIIIKKRATELDIWMMGRDAYPNETEEQIQERESSEDIFIIRKTE